MSSKYIGIMTILLALSASGFGSAFAGGAASVPEGGTPAEAASPPPKSPIRLSTIDFQDTAEGAGKLTIAGVALPGSEVYLFLDDEPFATVMPDDGGKWSIESGMKLENGRHTLRADTTRPPTCWRHGPSSLFSEASQGQAKRLRNRRRPRRHRPSGGGHHNRRPRKNG